MLKITLSYYSMEILFKKRVAMPSKPKWSAFYTVSQLANVAVPVLNVGASSTAVGRVNSVLLRVPPQSETINEN